MDRVLSRLCPIALGALLVLLPSMGPLIDHHFAERQPYHSHLGPDRGHEHQYSYFHAHGSEADPESNPALYNLDTSLAGFTTATLSESELSRQALVEPTSLIGIHTAADAALRSVYPAPPYKPPRL